MNTAPALVDIAVDSPAPLTRTFPDVGQVTFKDVTTVGFALALLLTGVFPGANPSPSAVVDAQSKAVSTVRALQIPFKGFLAGSDSGSTIKD